MKSRYNKSIKTVDDYIKLYPGEAGKRLKAIRALVKKGAPKAEERISYGMPEYRLNGILLYYGSFAKHTGLFALPSGVTGLKKELANYKTSKSSVQFPHNQPLPLSLIKKIIKYRVQENAADAKAKAAKKKKK